MPKTAFRRDPPLRRQGIVPTSKKNFGAASWEQVPRQGREQRGGPGCPAPMTAFLHRESWSCCSPSHRRCPRRGRMGSLGSPVPCPPPHPDRVRWAARRGEQMARRVRQLKENSQVLQSLFNLWDQYLCNVHVVGLNICYRIKYFCAALVTSLASSAWGCR